MEVLEKQLHVMDMTAISLAMDNQLPLVGFQSQGKRKHRKVVCGEDIGTWITYLTVRCTATSYCFSKGEQHD